VQVRSASHRTPRLLRLVLEGPELDGLEVNEAAASVRLLAPSPGTDRAGLVIPEWNGNEFLLPDGSRPLLRTLTPIPIPIDAHDNALAVDVVLHEGGPLSAWAAAAQPGDPAAISGPGRGYSVDADAPAFLVGGDESAVPAIEQVLAAVAETAPSADVETHIEITHPEAKLDLAGGRPEVHWHVLPPGARPGDELVEAMTNAVVKPDTRVWAAGEAAAVQRIRRHLFDNAGVPRDHATVRGYWKLGPGVWRT
jgi:NADPH-dependent ferric siderophore reductase